MRGRDGQSSKLFSYVSPEALVPPDHPLRAIKRLVDAALDRLSADFAMMYAATGRPSIPPEKLLRALLLQAFFTVRSERQLMQESLDQIELADRLGYDVVWETEHHFLQEYSHSSAPDVFLAAASQRTRNIRIGFIYNITGESTAATMAAIPGMILVRP